MQNFRGLRVWRKAFGLAINTRRTTQRFPRTGYAELKDQMIRAAESVYNNLVEGCGASTNKDFARFLDHSIKSSTELEGQFQLANGYGVLPRKDWLARQDETVETRKMLYRLRKKVLDADLSESGSDPKRTTQDPEPTTMNEAGPTDESSTAAPEDAAPTAEQPPRTPEIADDSPPDCP